MLFGIPNPLWFGHPFTTGCRYGDGWKLLDLIVGVVLVSVVWALPLMITLLGTTTGRDSSRTLLPHVP